MPGHLFIRFREDHRGTADDSEMLRQIRAFNWGESPAGAIESWPAELKYAARTMLLAEAPMAVLIGHQGILLYNDACRATFGDHYDNALGRSVMDILPEAGPALRRIIGSCHEGKGVRLRDEPLRLYRHGGWKTGWFNVAFTPVADEQAHVFGVMVSINETTDRMKALGALQQSRRRMELALDAGGIVGTWDFDISAGRVSINALFAELLGISAEEARQGVDMRQLAHFLHPDDRGVALTALTQAVRAGTEYRCQFRMVMQGGETRWLQGYGRPVRNRAGGTAHYAGVMIDINEQMQIAAALKESNLRYEMLAESVPQIVWSNDARGRHDYFNRRWQEFTGISTDIIRADGWVELIHPDDVARVLAHWQQCLSTGQNYDIDYRYRFRDGSYRWLRALAMPVRDAMGHIVRWYGTSTDIHEAKEIEAKRELIAHELDHRIKNLFALTNALVTLSVRDQPSLRPLADGLSARLTALHQAHGLIYGGADTQGGSMHDLLRALLRPYDRGQITIKGPDQIIGARAITSMALLFHELITNAAKYGALAGQGGALHIMFEVEAGRLTISWNEEFASLAKSAAALSLQEMRHSAGSAVSSAVKMRLSPDQAEMPPLRESDMRRTGFGSRLLEMIVTGQLRGCFDRTIKADGLEVRIGLPVNALG